MKKEWLLAVGVVIVTLLVTVGLIRWFAPQLLGIPVDLQAVRVSKEVPPFFENVFHRNVVETKDFLIKDPYTNVRARPFYFGLNNFGPHDLLGFRNTSIPNIADVITIGDSQTYGNNTVLSENWPSHLERVLKHKRSVVYSMATGGWGAVQYLNMFSYAAFFRPRVVIVAFYTGNDPDESVTLAYSVERWAPLRPDPELDLTDKPRFPGFPVPQSEQWQARFKDGSAMIFTPSLRLISNDTGYATVRAGYQIIEKVAQLMAESASTASIHLVLTVIPTKELVYAERVRRDALNANADYLKLVEFERANIARLAQSFKSLPGTEYVDLVKPLQTAAMTNDLPPYPAEADGHPMGGGGLVIARALGPAVMKHLVAAPLGLVAVRQGPQTVIPFLVTKDGIWGFSTEEIMIKNGWTAQGARVVDVRDIVSLSKLGIIDTVDPKKFGPQAVQAR